MQINKSKFRRNFIEVRINTLTPELFLKLYTIGWELPTIQQVQKILKNTMAVFKSYKNNNAVEIVRLICL